MTGQPVNKQIVTTEDLNRLEAFLLKGRAVNDKRAAQMFQELSDWQPALFTWLKDKVNTAETDKQIEEVINAQLIALIAIFEKQTGKDLTE